MKVAELFAELGFHVKNENLGQFLKSLAEVDMRSIAAIGGLKVVYDVLEKISTQAREAALSLNSFTVQTGQSSQELQKWANFAEQVGASAGDVESAFRTLQNKLTDRKLGKDQSLLEPFYYLNQAGAGINGDESLDEMMFKISKGIKGMNDDMARAVIQMLGFSEGMLNVYKSSELSAEALEKMVRMTDREEKVLMRQHKTIKQFHQALMGFYYGIISLISPVIEGWLKIATVIAKVVRNSLGLGIVLSILAAIALALAPIKIAVLGILILIGLLAQNASLVADAFIYLGKEIGNFLDSVHKKIEPVLSVLEKLLDAKESFGNFLSGGFGIGAAETARVTNNNNTSMTFTISSGTPAGIIDQIKDAWDKVMSETAYQRGLKSK